jgi:hypothetical protein
LIPATERVEPHDEQVLSSGAEISTKVDGEARRARDAQEEQPVVLRQRRVGALAGLAGHVLDDVSSENVLDLLCGRKLVKSE